MSRRPFALGALAMATIMLLAIACAGDDDETTAPQTQQQPAAAEQPSAAAAAADPSAPEAAMGTTTTTSTGDTMMKPQAPSAAAQAQFDAFPEDGMPQYGGTLRLGGAEARTLNFLDNTTSSTGKIANMIYDELVRWDWWADYANEPQVPAEGLSKAWSVSDDGTVWTFQLRDDVQWHDGTPFTCADVKATYDFLIDPGEYGPPGASYVRPFVETTACPDPHTVVLNLNGPAGSLLLNLAYHWASIVPKHKLDLSEDNSYFNANAVGTGPFMWLPDEHEADIRFKVARNDNYWEDGLPYLDAVDTFIMSDVASTLAAFETKRIDTTSQGSPTQQAGMIARNPDIRVVQRAAGGHSYILWNVRKPPFDDPKVRQAMYLWIDRAPFLEKAADGRGFLREWLNPDWNGGFGTSYEDLVKNNLAYRPDKTEARKRALELLAEVGWSDRSSVKIDVVARYTSGNSLEGNIILTSQLKAMGWDAELTSMDRLAGVQALRAGEYQAAYYGGNAGLPSPDATLNRYMGANGQRNYTGYSDPVFEKLVSEYNFTSDRAKREQTLSELDKHLQQGTYSMHVMVWGKTEAMEQDYMHGYDWTLGCCGQRYYHVWLEADAPSRN